MNFEEWCYSKQIKGNWKEALYHHLMAKYSENESAREMIDQLGQDEWAAAWSELLDHIVKNLPR